MLGIHFTIPTIYMPHKSNRNMKTCFLSVNKYQLGSCYRNGSRQKMFGTCCSLMEFPHKKNYKMVYTNKWLCIAQLLNHIPSSSNLPVISKLVTIYYVKPKVLQNKLKILAYIILIRFLISIFSFSNPSSFFWYIARI